MATDEDEHDDGSRVRPGAGPRQTYDDVASSLPPGAGRKADLGPRGDVDRQQPYDEGADGLRFDDVPRPESDEP
jgi:hypothetical protein